MYCGPGWQHAHWPQHKFFCISLAASQDRNVPQDFGEVKKTHDVFTSTKQPQTTDDCRPAEKTLDPAEDSFFIHNVNSGFPCPLKEGRRYVSYSKIEEAARFMYTMNKTELDTFIAEMTNISGWKSVQVVALLHNVNRVEEAREMMKLFPNHTEKFLDLIRAHVFY